MLRSRWVSGDEMSIEELWECLRTLDEKIGAIVGGDGREHFMCWARENGYGEIASLMEKGELP
jgi:hypothetical protein